MNRNRLCYILPKFAAYSEEHFAHTARTLEALAEHLDLTVIVKQAEGKVAISGAKKVWLQRARGPLRILELLWLLLRARCGGCRVFFTHYSYSGGICAALVAHVTGAKAYYWHCGQAKQYFPACWAPRPQVLAKKLLDELPLDLCLRLSHALVTGTLRMAEYYVREFRVDRGKIIIVPNDIDLARFQPRTHSLHAAKETLGLPADRPLVLFLHRLSPRKGAQYLAAIAQHVRADVPSVMFAIIGGGPWEELVREQIETRHLCDAVRMLGWVPNSQVRMYYAAADLFIMPSDEEGFPRVLLEAQAIGVPFVATNVGGVLDIVTPQQAENVVQKGDIAAFAKRVVALLRDPAHRGGLSAEGFRNVRQYAVEKVTPLFISRVVEHG